jgi:phosphoglycolate phosphatase
LKRKFLLVFDLDGTLIDSRRDIADACNVGLVAVGRPPLPVDEIATFVGDGIRNLLSRALGCPADYPLVDEALVPLLEYYVAHPIAHTTWLPGAREALELASDHVLCLATNKRTKVALAVLEALGVRDKFAAVTGGGDGPLKPDPAAIHWLVNHVGWVGEPKSVWMIGDGPQDIGAGKAAGATTVAVAGGFHSKEHLEALHADHLLDSLLELPPLLG